MPTRDEVLALTEQVHALAGVIEDEREAKRSAQKTVRRFRIGFGVLVVLMVWGILRANGAADEARAAAGTAQEAIDIVIEQRDGARLAACEKDNADANRENRKLDRDKELLSDTFNNPGQTTRAPDRQAQVDAYLADQFAKYDALRSPLRDCSPEGIRKFYEAQKGPNVQ